MKNLLAHLWADDSGAIISVEMILIIGILLFGIIPGIVALRNSVNAAFGTIGNTLVSIVPSFTFSGWSYVGSPSGNTIAVVQGFQVDVASPATVLAAQQVAPNDVGSISVPPAP